MIRNVHSSKTKESLFKFLNFFVAKFKIKAKEKLEKALQEQLRLKLDLNKLSRKNEQLESDVLEQKTSIESKDFDLSNLNQTICSLRVELRTSEKTIKDLQLHLENYKKLNDNENIRYQDLKSDNDELGKKVFNLTKENRNLTNKNELNENLINELEQKLVKAQEKRDSIERKTKLIEDQKLEIESQKITCQLQLESVNKKLKLYELEKDQDRKQFENLRHEKEKICLELKKSNLKKDNSKVHENVLRSQLKQIESEKFEAIKHIDSLKKIVADFDKERNEFVSNLNEAMLKTNNLNKQVKIQENDLDRNKKAIKSYSTKLEEVQQTLNVSQKETSFSHKNIASLKEDLRLANMNLEKYSLSEISSKKILNRKETELVRLRSENQKLEIQIGQLRRSLSEKETTISDFKAKINSFEISENKLLKIVKDMEKDLKAHKEIYLKCRNDFGMVSQSLIVRNHQIGYIYEQLEFMRKTLKEGEISYESKIKLINTFKIELSKVRKENEILRAQKPLIKILKEELDSKKHDLMIEKAKTDGNDKLHKSLTVHRWRKLKGCDPAGYLLILKINQLQKQLIFKSEQVADLQLKFLEKDKLFLELKQCMTRRILTEETSNIVENKNQKISKQSRQLKVVLFLLLY
jgi:chromosome segregation ATPase